MLLLLLLLHLVVPGTAQSCGGQWGLCGLVSSTPPGTTTLINLNPYSNAIATVGQGVPFTFVSGGLPHSTAPLFFFIGTAQGSTQLSLVAMNATDGSLSSAISLPPFLPGVLHAYAGELGLVVLVGQLSGSSSATVVGTVQPGVEGSWAQLVSLPDVTNPGLGGVATYVPLSQEVLFSLSGDGTGSSTTTLVACALAIPGGACRTKLFPEGLTLSSLSYSPQDSQVLALCTNSSNSQASLQAVEPQGLGLTLRGPLNTNFSALPPPSFASSSSTALLLGGGQYSSMVWLGQAAVGGGTTTTTTTTSSNTPTPSVGQQQQLYILMSNLCSGGGGPPTNQSTGLPLPLCGGGGSGTPCPVALGALFKPPPTPPPPPALDCSFSDSYPQQLVVYKLAPGQTIDVDGRLDDEVWAEVGWSSDFVDATTTTVPPLATRVKARWDDQFLYVGAYLQEPHVCANITSTCHCINPEEDQNIYDDNDFEAFIDPDGSCHYYKELEINAANATWDICLNQPYSNKGHGNSTPSYGPAGWDFPLPVGTPGTYHSAVFTDGVLNDPTSRPTFWSVEMAFPLASLAYNTTARVPPQPGDYWRALFAREAWGTSVSGDGRRYLKTPSCTTCANPGSPTVDNWSWTHLPAVSFHMPEAYGFLQFANSTVNATVPVRSREWPGRALAAQVMYAQEGYAGDHCGDYAATPQRLLPYLTGLAPEALMEGACTGGVPVGVSSEDGSGGSSGGGGGTPPRFNITVPGTVEDPQGVVTVNEERLFRVTRTS